MVKVKAKYIGTNGGGLLEIKGEIPREVVYNFFAKKNPHTFTPWDKKAGNLAKVCFLVDSREECKGLVEKLNQGLEEGDEEGKFDCQIEYQE